jgi:hypothetical protein
MTYPATGSADRCPYATTASWSDLNPAKRWLGVVSYAGATDVTLVSVG